MTTTKPLGRKMWKAPGQRKDEFLIHEREEICERFKCKPVVFFPTPSDFEQAAKEIIYDVLEICGDGRSSEEVFEKLWPELRRRLIGE